MGFFSDLSYNRAVKKLKKINDKYNASVKAGQDLMDYYMQFSVQELKAMYKPARGDTEKYFIKTAIERKGGKLTYDDV